MAPPDVFASTPTIGELSPATTAGPVPTRTPEIERTEILPVDPLTLQPRPGYDPIPMGDWMWGRPSPAGGYLAALVESSRGTSEVRLVDLAKWQVEGSWAQSPESGVLVTDDGTVYLAGSGQFQRLRLGDSLPEEVARLPSGFQPQTISPIFDGAFAIFGTRFQTAESASIVAIDVTTGMMNEIELPETRVGPRNPDSLEPGDPYISPFPVWDTAGNRALVLHGDEDVVSEIDLSTGVVTRQNFGVGDLPIDATQLFQRSGSISPDGRILYVSGQKVTTVADGGDSLITSESAGVIAVDTATWQVRSQTVEPIGQVMVSPRGDRILGWGVSIVEGDIAGEAESTGLFVLDAPSLTVLSRHRPNERQRWYMQFSFSDGGDIGYATSFQSQARVEAIDLASGEMIASIEGGDYLNMFGSIGVLHADAGRFTP
jgi:DNA-binding beta-propeller fold protein YncE